MVLRVWAALMVIAFDAHEECVLEPNSNGEDVPSAGANVPYPFP